MIAVFFTALFLFHADNVIAGKEAPKISCEQSYIEISQSGKTKKLPQRQTNQKISGKPESAGPKTISDGAANFPNLKLVKFSGPMKSHFPSYVYQGPLMDRMKAFASEFPDQVKIVNNVKFSIDPLKKESNRTLMVISSDKVSDKELKRIQDRYLAYFSDRVVSFPNTESESHLHSRLGKRDIDWFGNFGWPSDRNRFNKFEAGFEERLETTLELNEKEFENLQTYVMNAKARVSKVLGEDHYSGATGKLRGELTDNRPIDGGGHNCTSWICTAPIGQKKETLWELTKAKKEDEVYTNPGWWTSWLAAGAKMETEPLVVLWSVDPMDDTLKNRVRKGKFHWDFGRK